MPRTIADILGCASPTNTREPDDFYATPHECTEALIAAEADGMPMTVWDPCCGAGDISMVLQRRGREVVSTDLIDRGCGQGGVDFLLQRTALRSHRSASALCHPSASALCHPSVRCWRPSLSSNRSPSLEWRNSGPQQAVQRGRRSRSRGEG
jgi:hypothetical protein